MPKYLVSCKEKVFIQTSLTLPDIVYSLKQVAGCNFLNSVDNNKGLWILHIPYPL